MQFCLLLNKVFQIRTCPIDIGSDITHAKKKNTSEKLPFIMNRSRWCALIHCPDAQSTMASFCILYAWKSQFMKLSRLEGWKSHKIYLRSLYLQIIEWYCATTFKFGNYSWTRITKSPFYGFWILQIIAAGAELSSYVQDHTDTRNCNRGFWVTVLWVGTCIVCSFFPHGYADKHLWPLTVFLNFFHYFQH